MKLLLMSNTCSSIVYNPRGLTFAYISVEAGRADTESQFDVADTVATAVIALAQTV